MIFLKLGGSLITDKAQPEVCRQVVLQRLAAEIASARAQRPEMQLLVGHGSGSFGHVVAARHATHRGAATPEDWRGFAEVWRVANKLNRLVVDALLAAGLPVLAFPPSASAMAAGGEIEQLAWEPVQLALERGLLPVVAGDVAFDRRQGATILSTERVFAHLALRFRPSHLLLAGVEPGVIRGFPLGTEVIPVVSEGDLDSGEIGAATATDVTGGMADKVRHGLSLSRLVPGLVVRIFSGLVPGEVERALLGEPVGTQVVGTP
jgi:isopentenyl phosphate kinase